MAEIVAWGRDVGVPAAAWPSIDAGHDAYIGALEELDRSGVSALTLAYSSSVKALAALDQEREMVRRVDRLLEEEERLATAIRKAWSDASPEDALADGAVQRWRAKRLLELGSAVPTGAGGIYRGVRMPLPDLDALALSDAERRAAEAALAPHLPELIEKVKVHLRARARVLALGQAMQPWATPQEGDPEAAARRAQEIEPVLVAGRKARLGVLRAQQAARRSIVAAVTPERQEDVARRLLAEVAPGMSHTAVGGIAETLVPYLHDLDDRTQRKLATKIRQLRKELRAAEQRHSEALEQAIASADFDGLRSAGDAFESTLDELAEREGRGMVTLIGVRVLEPMVALEVGRIEGEDAREALAKLVPATRVEDFLRDLSIKEPSRAALFERVVEPARTYPGALLTLGTSLGPDVRSALEAQLTAHPALLAQVRRAVDDHARRWQEIVVPAQRRFREAVGADAEEGEVRMGLKLTFADGQLALDHQLDLQPAIRAASEVDLRAAEADAELFATLEPLLVAVVPEAIPALRTGRAWELYAGPSSAPLSASVDPRIADPVEALALLADAGVSPSEQAACLLVASSELAEYDQALRERLDRLTEAALLRRYTSELRYLRGQLWSPEEEVDLPEAERRLVAKATALRVEAATAWRSRLARVFEAWSAVLAPSDLEAVRDAALRRAYPGLAEAMRPVEAFVAEGEVSLQRLAEEDPRRAAGLTVLDARWAEARRSFREIALAIDRAASVSSGMAMPAEATGSATGVESTVGATTSQTDQPRTGPPPVPEVPSGAPAMGSVQQWKRVMSDRAARAVRDLWVVTGDPRVLDRPAALRVLRVGSAGG